METLIHILIIVGTFLFMESVAWFTHKYIMHGILWSWHRSHHTMHDHTLEKNDLFAVVFSIPSIALIAIGHYIDGWEIIRYFGYGVTSYGIFYFLFHDVLVHRRIKLKIHPKSGYLKRIMNAHYVHHKKHTKEDGEAFGFLWASNRYSEN
ncbi:MAG: sterol desaturase family protein [Cyclobacteriaceae bacterium]